MIRNYSVNWGRTYFLPFAILSHLVLFPVFHMYQVLLDALNSVPEVQ